MTMYLNHFGMHEQPFTITPDTSFFFPYGCYMEAYNVLVVALRSGEGFIKVTGEVGTGKTLLCRKLMSTLGKDFEVAYIPNPHLQPEELIMALAEELGIPVDATFGQHHLLKLINYRLMALASAGKQIVLCLDEAQTIPDESLEYLRLLTNLETEKKKLLQIVLFGQPELNARLNSTSFRQLRQRITFSYDLPPIDWKGFNAYIGYRLFKAGYRGRLFMPDAVSELYKKSRGIPRLVNILCHKSLMAAYGLGHQTINRKHIKLAVRDTESIQTWKYTRSPRLVYEILAIMAVITMLIGIVSSTHNSEGHDNFLAIAKHLMNYWI
jgi:MSHA biogenesis protein MshM